MRDIIILTQFEGCKKETIDHYYDSTRLASKPYALWQLDFARVFREKGGFDIIIGNPPYGARFSASDKKILNKIYKSCNVPDYESADFFIEISSQIIKEDGILSFIIPNTFMANLNARKYRVHLLETWNVAQIDNLSAVAVFDSASVRNCIVYFEKSNNIKESKFTKLTISSGNILPLIQRDFKVSELYENIDNWLNLLEKDKVALSITKKMDEISVRLREISEISQGLIPYDKYRGHSEETIKNKIWNADHQKDETYRKELRGKDVDRYLLKWNGIDWISYGNWLATPRRPEYFTTERILVREITNPRILATITSDEYYNTPSIINCINFTEDIYSVLGIINSKLLSFYHNMVSPKASKGLFPKILVNDVRNLPICLTKSDTVNKISTLVKELITGEAKVYQYDERIDELVYQLYGISKEEIAYIENWFANK